MSDLYKYKKEALDLEIEPTVCVGCNAECRELNEHSLCEDCMSTLEMCPDCGEQTILDYKCLNCNFEFEVCPSCNELGLDNASICQLCGVFLYYNCKYFFVFKAKDKDHNFAGYYFKSKVFHREWQLNFEDDVFFNPEFLFTNISLLTWEETGEMFKHFYTAVGECYSDFNQTRVLTNKI